LSKIEYSDLIGVPYKLNGRDKTGFDCYGLVHEMFKRNGITLPDYNYTDDSDETITKLIVDNFYLAIELKEPEPYCGVLFRQYKWGTHMGVVLSDKLHFIHCSAKKSVAVEKLTSPVWRTRIMGYYTWKTPK
jgi:hypothetical protein